MAYGALAFRGRQAPGIVSADKISPGRLPRVGFRLGEPWLNAGGGLPDGFRALSSNDAVGHRVIDLFGFGWDSTASDGASDGLPVKISLDKDIEGGQPV